MSAAEVKAPQTAAFTTSGDITVAAGSQVTVGIYSDEAGGIGGNEWVNFFVKTPATPIDNLAFTLRGGKLQEVVVGPCTVYGVKGVTTRKIGVFKDVG
jgi:hypothetical protein